MSAYILGMDVGTSACKAALFRADGTPVSQATREYSAYYPQPGWAEQDPLDWWQNLCAASRELIGQSGIHPSEIAGIGIGGQSWSAIALDADGEPLCNTPIWTDTRARKECAEITRSVAEEKLFALCGNPVQPSYTLPKILWYKNNRPGIYQKLKVVLQSNSFIVYKLTGQITQDVSQGYGLCCFDIRKRAWDLNVAKALGIRGEMLPQLYQCHDVVGTVTREAARLSGLLEGTPVVAGGLDAACGTLGAGVINQGQTQEQGGQAGGMSLCLDHCTADPRLILSAHVVPDRWLLQGGSTGGGGVLKWIRQTICPELNFKQMDDLAAKVPAGCDGVVFLPYMAGERSPIWNPNASGVFFGLSYAKTRGHLIRAAMEGVGFSLRHNLEIARLAGADAQSLRAVGGSANSRVWTQIKADITNRAIDVPASDMATTLGAAILAGVGTGIYQNFSDACARTVKITRSHQPNPALKAIYDTRYAQYRELYTRLEPMMGESAGSERMIEQ